MRRTIDDLSCAGSNCVGVVVGVIQGPRAVSNSRYESPKVSPVKMRAVIDDRLMVQGVARCVYTFEHTSREVELLPVPGDGEPFWRDGQYVAVQLRVELVAIYGAGAGDELRRVDHVGRAARMHHADGVRERLHQGARAAGMVEMHVCEKQQVHRFRRQAQLFEPGEYQRNGRVGTGIDDGRASARHDDM
jgi:hypothetical protein